MKAVMLACMLLSATASAAGRVAPLPVAGLPGATLGQQAGRLVLHLPSGARVPLSWDGYCDPCLLFEAQRVPGGPASALAIISRHESRPGTPMGFCGAGQETVLHLLVRKPRWHEAAALRLDSCLRSTEVNKPPHWDGPVLSVQRWSATPPGTQTHAWRIGPGLGVAQLEPPL